MLDSKCATIILTYLIDYDDSQDAGHHRAKYPFSHSEKFFYLADTNPPKDVPKAFFFNIDNVYSQG